jgi:hypothetical protein
LAQLPFDLCNFGSFNADARHQSLLAEYEGIGVILQ